MAKRTLDSFFKAPPEKKLKTSNEASAPISLKEEILEDEDPSGPPTNHPTYPFELPALPKSIVDTLQYSPAAPAKQINDRPHLDLLYFQPFIDSRTAQQLFRFLRSQLFFYRVKYKIKRGSIETDINTPRYTTVFGLDETSKWHKSTQSAETTILEASSGKPVDSKKYSRPPRPIPECLETLRHATEAVTGETFNFCLVNYYADGNDSISYHSDDERFLGPNPAIASFSLGSKRDFLMKHKPRSPGSGNTSGKDDDKPLKLPLGSGDMVLMRGETQGKWLHSVPKRKGGQGDGGRINITFRKALVKGGTDNYYCYNVGEGEAYRWDDNKREMLPWRRPNSSE